MFVRKFEADTIEEALKEIKNQLGPDAIILKTVTNAGIKGAFKKKKIEITAAISEDNYTKKARVDNVLNPEQKEKFYQNNAGYIANMINEHNDHQTAPTGKAGYGKLALNKTVNSSKTETKSGLDEFLNQNPFSSNTAEKAPKKQSSRPIQTEEQVVAATSSDNRRTTIANQASHEMPTEFYDRRIEQLELKIHDLTKSFEKFDKKEPVGLYQLRATLRSLDINEIYINRLVKKAIFELKEEELQDVDLVYEVALREMLNAINTSAPLFSTQPDQPTVTLLLSDASSGQTSLAYKMASLKGNTTLIKVGQAKEKSFTEKMMRLDCKTVEHTSEIVSLTRKALEQNKSVVIDYKDYSKDQNEVKKFIEGMRRAFSPMEVLICLSAIHNEIYNNKVINSYRTSANGVVVTNLDLCVNFGALFNTLESNQKLPVKFFGTGPVVPEDIEVATSERILGALFELK
jgi:flagellar biosynthesis protein FlhF